MNLFLGKEELNYVLGIQEKGLSNRLGLKKKDGYPLWTAASWFMIGKRINLYSHAYDHYDRA